MSPILGMRRTLEVYLALVVEGRLAKGNTTSLNTTSCEIYTRPMEISRHL
jgi:hypothetical protein